MRFHTAIACAAILLGCAASSSAQTVSLQFNNGRVTLNAQNASIRTILAEWARVGGTRMVNHERVNGAPVTLELTDVPERQALEVLLRTAAGYIATARTGEGGASTLSGVVILATSSAPRNQGPVTFNNTTVLLPAPTVNEEQQNEANSRTVSVTPFPPTPGTGTAPVVVRVGAGATTFGTTTDTSAQATQSPSQQRPATTTTPQVLQGTSRPGEITPPAPQPQQNQR
ncbi:MAG TPA: hypothetical protein VM846_15545 [Vicinamibacterales bacterium]|jgi:hypothetical protein|nr:hypothetical protein [Vicinamibacterales bacterium]